MSRVTMSLLAFLTALFVACAGSADRPFGASRKQDPKADEQRKRLRNREEQFGSSVQARTMAIEFVRRQLAMPEAADFGWLGADESAVLDDDGWWTVRGTVQARTRIGATVSCPYACVLKKMGATWHERLTVVNP